MKRNEELYIMRKLHLIEATVAGACAAQMMFGKDGNDITFNTKGAMELIENDIRKIYSYAKRKGFNKNKNLKFKK